LIGKILAPSSDVGGALRYVLKKEGAEVLPGGTLHGQSFRSLKSQFDVYSQWAKTDAKKLVFHGILAVPPEESGKNSTLSVSDWSAIGRRYMTELGYADAPFVLVKHSDTDHTHVHIVGLRLDAQGKQVRHGFEWVRSRKVVDVIEADYGLKPGGPPRGPQGADRRAPASNEVQGLRRHLKVASGQELTTAQLDTLPRQQLWGAFDRALTRLQDAPELKTVGGFARALSQEGVRLVPNVAKTTDRVSGLRYVHEETGRSFTARQLGADATLGGLDRRGIGLTTEDVPRLRQAKAHDLVVTGRAPTDGLAGATVAQAALDWQDFVHGGARRPASAGRTASAEPTTTTKPSTNLSTEPTPSAPPPAGPTTKEVYHQVRAQIRTTVDEVLHDSSLTLSAFIERLGKRGVDVELNASTTTGRVSGLTYIVGEHRMKASQVGKPYGLPALQQKGLTDVRVPISSGSAEPAPSSSPPPARPSRTGREGTAPPHTASSEVSTSAPAASSAPLAPRDQVEAARAARVALMSAAMTAAAQPELEADAALLAVYRRHHDALEDSLEASGNEHRIGTESFDATLALRMQQDGVDVEDTTRALSRWSSTAKGQDSPDGYAAHVAGQAERTLWVSKASPDEVSPQEAYQAQRDIWTDTLAQRGLGDDQVATEKFDYTIAQVLADQGFSKQQTAEVLQDSPVARSQDDPWAYAERLADKAEEYITQERRQAAATASPDQVSVEEAYAAHRAIWADKLEERGIGDQVETEKFDYTIALELKDQGFDLQQTMGVLQDSPVAQLQDDPQAYAERLAMKAERAIEQQRAQSRDQGPDIDV
jgi:hypothetical protein